MDQDLSQYREQLTFTGYSKKYPHLPLALEGIGLYHMQEYCSRPFGIAAWQWVQSVEGRGELLLDGITYCVEPGCGILLPVSCKHDYYSISERWMTNFLCINGALLNSFVTLLDLVQPSVYQISTPSYVLECEEQIFSLCQENSIRNAFEISKLLYGLLVELSLDIKRSHTSQSQPQNLKVQQAISYMHAHYNEPIGLFDIADHLNLSKEYLCQLFKRTTNSTLLEYLTQIRLAEAKTMLLKFPEMTVKEISRRCGFESPSYFCSVFKKHEHMTPLQFCQSRR